jgi:hypothetical protein
LAVKVLKDVCAVRRSRVEQLAPVLLGFFTAASTNTRTGARVTFEGRTVRDVALIVVCFAPA